MAGRPSKPFTVLKAENKSHKTKAELEVRKKGEEALVTESPFKESADVKKNPVAHKQFMRLKSLYKKINKNDALVEGVVNRYCIMQAEYAELQQKRSEINERIEKLYEMEFEEEPERYKLIDSAYKQYFSNDRNLNTKANLLLAMEKEMLMTLAAQMRSIPKTPTEENTDDDMSALLNRRKV